VGIDRRQAIRAAGALTVAATGAVGCDTPAPHGTGPASAAPPHTSASAGSPGAPSAAPSGAPLPAEIAHGPRDRPAVALTFHGQGDWALIHSLLGVLATGGVRVTVMAVGRWLAANEALGRQIVAGGHELGNHTYNHLDIDHLPADHAYTEITSCAQVLRSVTGSIGPWFRPSQTQHASAQVRALATRAGYLTCLSYDVDSLDYTDPSADTVVRATLDGVSRGSIVSMHFGHAVTVTAMPRILSGLRAKGLQPVTVSELLRP
jgi:peptidoglycan/xylan/chitin deacetylase (PgdA/CDA1 family)